MICRLGVCSLNVSSEICFVEMAACRRHNWCQSRDLVRTCANLLSTEGKGPFENDGNCWMWEFLFWHQEAHLRRDAQILLPVRGFLEIATFEFISFLFFFFFFDTHISARFLANFRTWFVIPCKHRTSKMFCGWCRSMMAFTFSGTVWSPCLKITYPRIGESMKNLWLGSYPERKTFKPVPSVRCNERCEFRRFFVENNLVVLYQRMVARKKQKHNCKKQRTRRHVKMLTIVLETSKTFK